MSSHPNVENKHEPYSRQNKLCMFLLIPYLLSVIGLIFWLASIVPVFVGIAIILIGERVYSEDEH